MARTCGVVIADLVCTVRRGFRGVEGLSEGVPVVSLHVFVPGPRATKAVCGAPIRLLQPGLFPKPRRRRVRFCSRFPVRSQLLVAVLAKREGVCGVFFSSLMVTREGVQARGVGSRSAGCSKP